MRLIDAELLKREMIRESLRPILARRNLLTIIDDAPSIEAEPVRRGRWVLEDIPYTEWYRITCSECGENETSTAPCIGGVVIWDYCPWCGAKMDVEKI